MASQYYAQIGIGNIARPMVVGDRLWLFSQPSAASHSHSLLLNNNSPMSLIRGYGVTQQITPSMPVPVLPSSPSMSTGNHKPNAKHIFLPQTGFGIPKPSGESFHPNRMSSQVKPYELLGNRRCFTDMNHTKYPFGNFFPNNGHAKTAEILPAAAFLNKFKMSAVESDGQHSGITELERAFGSSEKCSQLMNTVDATKLINATVIESAAAKTPKDTDDCFTENSDVDCEELDDA